MRKKKSKFSNEIKEAIRDLARRNHVTIDKLQYVLVERESGFIILTVEGYKKLNAKQRNILFPAPPKIQKVKTEKPRRSKKPAVITVEPDIKDVAQ